MSDAPPDPTPPPRFDWNMVGYWTGVFLANLPVPMFLALCILPRIGILGLIAGLAALYWIGLMVCGGRFRVGRSLTVGGLAVAALQIMPVLHVMLGFFGLRVWEWMSGRQLGAVDPEDLHTPGTPLDGVGAFVVVLLTAQPMWMIAILAGSLFRWWAGDKPIWFHSSADPTENPAS